jgi:hypothetical protein
VNIPHYLSEIHIRTERERERERERARHAKQKQKQKQKHKQKRTWSMGKLCRSWRMVLLKSSSNRRRAHATQSVVGVGRGWVGVDGWVDGCVVENKMVRTAHATQSLVCVFFFVCV